VAVLVLRAGTEDPEAALVIGGVARRGVEAVGLDLFDLPSSRVGLSLSAAGESGWVQTPSKRIALGEISAVWAPLLRPAVRTSGMDEEARLLAEDEWRAFLEHLYFATSACPWVNPPGPALETNSKVH
jgi:hypothetical protein